MEQTRGVLGGENTCGVEEIRRLRDPLNEVDQVVRHSSELRIMMPERNGQWDEYKSQFPELQTILAKIHVVLPSRPATLAAGRTQLESVARWASAFQATR